MLEVVSSGGRRQDSHLVVILPRMVITSEPIPQVVKALLPLGSVLLIIAFLLVLLQVYLVNVLLM